MKVNNIQNYTPNFGALLFKPKSSQYLKTLGQKALADVEVVRKNLENTEFYNLEIRETPVISHISGDKIYPPFNVNKAGKCLIIRGKCGAQPVSIRMKMENGKQVDEMHKDIVQSDTQILRSGKIVKYLDEYEKKLKE